MMLPADNPSRQGDPIDRSAEKPDRRRSPTRQATARRPPRGTDYLLKHPELRGKDVETTRKACARFSDAPTTVINFVEGTRFTAEKAREARSPYQHLMQPKAAGLSLALAGMNEQFEKIINVTLDYPDSPVEPFRDLLCGRMRRIRRAYRCHHPGPAR